MQNLNSKTYCNRVLSILICSRVTSRMRCSERLKGNIQRWIDAIEAAIDGLRLRNQPSSANRF